jgi:hypothetical protein
MPHFLYCLHESGLTEPRAPKQGNNGDPLPMAWGKRASRTLPSVTPMVLIKGWTTSCLSSIHALAIRCAR